jgi:hypothetical protein
MKRPDDSEVVALIRDHLRRARELPYYEYDDAFVCNLRKHLDDANAWIEELRIRIEDKE